MLESNGRIWTSTDDEDDKTSFASSSRSTSPRPSSLSLPVTPSSQSAKSSYFPTVKDDEIDFTRQEPSHDLGYQVENRKRRGNLPKPVTAILKSWLVENCTNPYPTEEEKNWLKQETGLTLNQISNWFINARRRILPMILIKASAHLDKPLEHHRKRRGKPPSANRRTKQQTRRQCTVQQRGKRSAAAAELYDTDRVTKSTRRYWNLVVFFFFFSLCFLYFCFPFNLIHPDPHPVSLLCLIIFFLFNVIVWCIYHLML